jgi:hypothetical protein
MTDDIAFEAAEDEARAIQSQTGFPPALDDPRLNARSILFWLSIEGDGPLDDLIEKQHGKDHAARAVVGATLHVLMGDNPTGEAYDSLEDAFGRFVESVSIADLSDPNLLRWELHVAAAAGSVERVLEIARRFESVGTTVELRLILARTLFALLHPGFSSFEGFNAGLFDPRIRATHWNQDRLLDFITYLLATTVSNEGELAWSEPDTFPALALDALIEIDAMLQRVENVTKSLTPTQRAIQCWVWFAAGAAAHDVAKLNEAGRTYEVLASYPAPEEIAERGFNGVPSAARCFARAGNWASAKEAARRWVAQEPQNPYAHRQLAEAHYKLSEIPEALRAFEDYVRHRTHPDEEGDWQASLLLQLGFEVHHHKATRSAIEMAAFSARIRPQGETLIAWFLPWFDHLCRKAKERWWVGMFQLSSPHVAAEMETERWDIAADSFGEAVSFELKARVFGPFADFTSLEPPDDYWKRALVGRATLGEMVGCLLQVRMKSHPMAQQLASWLRTNNAGLFAYLHTPYSYRLSVMAATRGEAQHGSVNESQTREVFTEAAAVLKAMASKQP